MLSIYNLIFQIQCESCDMWFHEECLDMAEEDLKQARTAD